MHALTCEGLDARALKQPGRAVVIVQLLVRQVEAGVDAAVLLRDLSIVKVRGGSHGGSQRGRQVRGRRPGVLRWPGSVGRRARGDETAGRTSNSGGSLKQRGRQQRC